MSEEEPKKNLHFHLGGVIILIIFVVVLLNVDLKKTIESPRFQSNMTYIKGKAEDMWKQYLSKPMLYIWNNLFSDMISKGVQQVKDKAVEGIKTQAINQINSIGTQGQSNLVNPQIKK